MCIPGERFPGCLPSAAQPGQLERLAGLSTKKHTEPVGVHFCHLWPDPPPQTSAWKQARSARHCLQSYTQIKPCCEICMISLRRERKSGLFSMGCR